MKKKRFFTVLSLVAAFVLTAAVAVGGLLDNDPFLNESGAPVWARDLETLVYRVSFFGIPAGYAEFQYVGEEKEGERRLYHIRLRAWTTGLVKFFKEIHDVFDFYIDAESLLPHKVVERKRESGKVKEKVSVYDQEKGVITYYSLDGKKIGERKVVPHVFESVSVAYFLRTKDLLFDAPEVIVYGGKKLFKLRIQVEGKERVKTEAGVFDTIKIKPDMERIDGGTSKKYDVTAWTLDDGSGIPVLVHASLKVGTLTGELVSFIRGDK